MDLVAMASTARGSMSVPGYDYTPPVWETWLADGGGFRRNRRRHIPRVAASGGVSGGGIVIARRVSPVVASYIPMLTLARFLGELGTRRDGGVSGGLGIDLKKRAHEVRKLFYAGGFTRTLLREGIDPEDFLQEVYRGLLTRNNGTCPWDHSKSSFGHYVHIVIRCLLSNYLRKERRHTSMEEVSTDGELVAGAVGPSAGGEDFNRRDLLRDVFGEGKELDVALTVVSALEGGGSRKEVADQLGLPLPTVDGILRRVRIGLST